VFFESRYGCAATVRGVQVMKGVRRFPVERKLSLGLFGDFDEQADVGEPADDAGEVPD
jgi:hypothetical protein